MTETSKSKMNLLLCLLFCDILKSVAQKYVDTHSSFPPIIEKNEMIYVTSILFCLQLFSTVHSFTYIDNR